MFVLLTPSDNFAPNMTAPATAIAADGETVNLRPDNPQSPEYYTFTDGNGAYTIKGVPAGQYVAVAARPGLEPSVTNVTITANQVLNMDFKLTLYQPKVGIIEGAVRNAETQAPLPNVAVYAIMSIEPQPATGAGRSRSTGGGGSVITPDEFVMMTTTDSQGRYKLLVPPAVTGVGFRARGFVPQQLPVTVAVSSTMQVDCALQPQSDKLGAVTGVVTDAVTGKPISGVQVGAVDAFSEPGTVLPPTDDTVSTMTDAQGKYTLHVPESVTQLAFYAKGYSLHYMPVTVIPDGAVTVDVKLAPFSNTDVILNGSVNKRSADGAITPVPHALVYAMPHYDGPQPMSMPVRIFSAETTEQGYYKLALPAGQYNVYAEKDGVVSPTVTVLIFENLTQEFFLE